MKTCCNQINQVIEIAEKHDNDIFDLPDERDERGKFVVWMRAPLINLMRDEIDSMALKLKYWHSPAHPHSSETFGYTCEKCRVVIVFPGT